MRTRKALREAAGACLQDLAGVCDGVAALERWGREGEHVRREALQTWTCATDDMRAQHARLLKEVQEQVHRKEQRARERERE